MIPAAIREQDYDVLPFLTFAAVPVNELLMGGNVILNITIPAAVAAAMGKSSPQHAAEAAESGAYISNAIPGACERAERVAMLAAHIVGQIGE